MTAGRGIVHAEMPRQNPDGSANVGLQLWVDLPKDLKACEPRYRDLRGSEIPSVDVDDGRVTVKVISGQSHGIDSVKDLAYTPVWILDITVRSGGSVTQPLPQGWNAFAYTLDGDILVGKKDGDNEQVKVAQYHNIVFEPAGDVIHLEVDANAPKPARIGKLNDYPLPNFQTSSNSIERSFWLTILFQNLVLIAGTPLDQSVVQYGPFVLSSKEDVYQALFDYQTHSNGFERAKDWESEIGKSMMNR